MTSGFAGSTTMTVFCSTTFVSTFCCSFDVEGALVLRLLPHPLDGVHDVALLGEEGVAEVRRPLDVVREPLHHVGNRRHRLDGRVPRLLGDRVGQRLVLQLRVLRQPLLELDDLERVGGRHERLGEERVGVEGDRRHQRVELVRRELRRGRLGPAAGAAGVAVSCARRAPSPGTRSAAQKSARRVRKDLSRSRGRSEKGIMASPSCVPRHRSLPSHRQEFGIRSGGATIPRQSVHHDAAVRGSLRNRRARKQKEREQ